MSLNYFRAQQTLAMRAVLKAADGEYLLRRIYRYYSINFNTPLHEVEALPLADVLTHYYEHMYENMDEDRREVIRTRLAMTDEEREKDEKEREEDEEGNDDFMKEVEAEEQARIAKLKAGGVETASVAKPKKKDGEDEGFGEGEPPPPDIKMSFASDKDFSSVLEAWDKRGA